MLYQCLSNRTIEISKDAHHTWNYRKYPDIFCRYDRIVLVDNAREPRMDTVGMQETRAARYDRADVSPEFSGALGSWPSPECGQQAHTGLQAMTALSSVHDMA